MTTSYVLAIDAGTSGVRCLITDLSGRPVSLCRRKWNYRTPSDTNLLGREFDPAQFWHLICATVMEAVSKANVNAEDIAGISATSQREGAVFLDGEGKELYGGPNIDLRALTEGVLLDSKFGEEIYAVTGHIPSFLFVPAMLKWFENNRPAIHRRINTVLTISDWIIYRLCGERVGEICGACELGLVDIQARRLSESLSELLDLPLDLYPEPVPAGAQVGKVTRQAASETGIPESTAVVQGAPDTHCGLLTMGVKDNGELGVIFGWSAPVQQVTDKPALGPEGKTWVSCHLFPQKWILESSAGEAGNVYRWLKELMFEQGGLPDDKAYQVMDRLAMEAPSGEVLAFIGPAAMDINHLAMKPGGFLFPVPLSANNIRRGHLVRAFLENLCFAVKANSIQLKTISGLKIEKVIVGGALAKSQCLMQILPNVLGVPICVPELTEVSALGAAICAAVGAGGYSGLEEGAETMTPEFRVAEPDRLSVLEYEEYYQRWLSTSQSLERLGEEVGIK